MKKIVLYSLMCLVLLGCSKEIKKNKNLDGSWTLMDLSVIDYNGLKEKPEFSGGATFSNDGKKSKSGTYVFSMLFDFQNESKNMIEKGSYVFIGPTEILLTDDETGTSYSASLTYMTNEDLILEIPNKAYIGYTFILKK